jgi:hypothetical protein
MDSVSRTVQQWSGLDRESLSAKVAGVVHQPPADPAAFWSAVRENVVLAAAVRGVLAGLLRDKQGSRDEAFWAYRIASARAALDKAAEAPTRARATKTATRVAERVAEPEPVLTVPDRPTARPRPAIPAVEFLAP